jgi:hypothetical protein
MAVCIYTPEFGDPSYLLGGFPYPPRSFHTVHSRIDFRIMGLLFGTKQQISLVQTTASAAFRIWSFLVYCYLLLFILIPLIPIVCLSLHAPSACMLCCGCLNDLCLMDIQNGVSYSTLDIDLERGAHVLVCSLCTMIPYQSTDKK